MLDLIYAAREGISFGLPLLRFPIPTGGGWKLIITFYLFLLYCEGYICTSVANCCKPPILMGPSSEAYKLQPPTHKSLVGHTIPQVKPTGLSLKITLAAP